MPASARVVLPLCALLACAASLPVAARQAELVDLPFRALRTPDGSALTRQKVEAAIRDGARTQGWRVIATGPGRLVLRLSARTHASVVQVDFDDRGFDIGFVSATDLDLEARGGKTYIHATYNQWTRELADAIAASRSLLAQQEGDATAPLLPPVLTTVRLEAPVYLQSRLLYRPGDYVKEAIKSECRWDSGYAGLTQHYAKGLVKVTREDIATLPGYTARASVDYVYASHGYVGPTWAAITVELFDNGQLIGELKTRREVKRPLNDACSSLGEVAERLAEDTVHWLQAGKFEARPDAPRLMPAAAGQTATTGE